MKISNTLLKIWQTKYKNSKLGGLDLSWLCLDPKSRSQKFLKVVLTVKKFSTVWKTMSWLSRYSWQFEKRHLNKSRQSLCPKASISLDFWQGLDQESKSWHPFKVSLDNWESLNILKKDISTSWDISILISLGLDCRDPQA